MLKSQTDLETTQMTSGLRVTDDSIGFNKAELIACTRCGKSNGPDRTACLYCGEDLPVTGRKSVETDLELRKLEAWEPAFNLLVLSKSGVVDSDVSAAAKLVGVDKSVLVSILDSALPLPVARIETKDLVDMAAEKLLGLGVTAAVVADTELKPERPPIRLRNVATVGGDLFLTNFNSGTITRINSADVVLMVTGRIVQTRRDEVTKRKRGKTKVVDEIETGSDLRLIDLYTDADVIGYRIQTSGFDFSVLGADKSMLASENIERLADFLRRHCPNAVGADEYDAVRGLLDAVWEPEARKDVQGLQLRTYGKHEFGATYTSSNLTQFTKYSRMRRLLI